VILESLLAIALVLAPPASQADLATPPELLESAFAALESGDPQAERLFREILADYPTAFEAVRGLALALARQERTSEATGMLLTLGARLQQSGWSRDALPLLELAVELAPRMPAARYFLGAALSDEGRFASAVDQFRAALDLGDNQVATRVSLAAALWEAGDLDASEEQYRAALAQSVGDPIVLHQFASLLLFTGRPADARNLLEQAAEKTSPSAYLLLDLARASQEAGDVPAAIEAARAAVDLEPALAQAHYQLALLLSRAGDRAGATTSFAAYSRLADETQRQQRAAFRLQAEVDEAEQLWLRDEPARVLEVLRNVPDVDRALELRAAAYSRLGLHAEAAHALERAVALAPERRDLQAWLAREQDLERRSR
jgi:tetratricopeptide (TPR) repeat protein